MFRFLKHSFKLADYHATNKLSFCNWVAVQMVAYVQLVLAKMFVVVVKLPWNTRRAVSDTPFSVWKNFKPWLRLLWCPVRVEKNFQPGPGKPYGTVQKKRKRYPIVRKHHVVAHKAPT